jgi:hypothetical protein
VTRILLAAVLITASVPPGVPLKDVANLLRAAAHHAGCAEPSARDTVIDAREPTVSIQWTGGGEPATIRVECEATVAPREELALPPRAPVLGGVP